MGRTRNLTALFAAGRLAFGVGLLAAPATISRGWIGPDAERAPVKIALRGVGGRDIALSAGALASLGDRERLQLWLAGAIVADLCDTASTLAAPGGSLPDNARWGTVALGGGAALAGAALLRAVRS